jgi:endonuclease/exonuclease/phosphatase family metal-dependent hydrolase
MWTTSRRLLAAATSTALLGLPVVGLGGAPAQAAPPDGHGAQPAPSVTVMTRNLYLGADIMRPIEAVRGLTDPAALVQALGNATDLTRDNVERTDFRVRARLLARELARTRPDLVGLQEVALWRSGPLELGEAELLVPNAETVDQDFLRMLTRELRRLRVPYRPVSVNWLSDVEAPAFEGAVGSPEFLASARDVRLTMRDVILRRVGSHAKVVRHREAHFATTLPIEIAGRTLDFTRGYQWVDARGPAGRFRFVNTHLEAFRSDIALAQVQEVLDGPAAHRGTTILVCDCNSDPLDGSVREVRGDTQPHWAPYRLITGPHRFVDTWLRWAPAEEGFTSGTDELAVAADFDRRIDMVFARGKHHRPVRVLRGAVTGNEPRDRGPGGLYPSDHAGVVMKLRLPR